MFYKRKGPLRSAVAALSEAGIPAINVNVIAGDLSAGPADKQIDSWKRNTD